MFSKYDTGQRGCLSLAKVYQMIGEKKSIFGDSLFELIGKRYLTTEIGPAQGGIQARRLYSLDAPMHLRLLQQCR